METTIREGSDQPGTRRSLRRGRRSTNGAEIGLGRTSKLLGVEVARVCLWIQAYLSRKRLWALIKDSEAKEWVKKITKVRQQSGRIRFDLFAEKGKLKRMARTVKRLARSLLGYARLHIAYRKRKDLKRLRGPLDMEGAPVLDRDARLEWEIAGGGQQVGGNNNGMQSLKAVTWNINSVTSKRNQLEMFLQATGVHILALQETRRGKEAWPLRQKGYNILEVCADREAGLSRNGLALYVKDTLSMHEVGVPSDYAIAARVRMGPEEWTVMTVYVPSVSHRRTLALAHIRSILALEFNRDLAVKLLLWGIGIWRPRS